mmetsp:Transcript_6025/g.20618  ORF Transcript_6025/g.20618 Transcript_6025/m.20618 type:complete len:213 (-) Transcript_6025:139-777(-)
MAMVWRRWLPTSHASRKPAMIVIGWIFWATRRSASLMSSPANTTTLVVPSPTSSSWTLEISTRTLAAGLSMYRDLRMVAPSLVTMMLLALLMDWRILSCAARGVDPRRETRVRWRAVLASRRPTRGARLHPDTTYVARRDRPRHAVGEWGGRGAGERWFQHARVLVPGDEGRTMPLGPRVVFTRSAMAMAPMKEARRAVSPFSSDAPCWSML